MATFFSPLEVATNDIKIPLFLSSFWCKAAYAEACQGRSFELGILDAALLCLRRKQQLLCVYYDDEFVGKPSLTTVFDVLRKIIPDVKGISDDPPIDPSRDDTIVLAAIHAHYERGSFRQLNHWVPLFHSSKLGEDLFDLCVEERLKKLQRQEQKWLAQLEDDDSDFERSINDALRSVNNQKTFTELMGSMGFFAENVPGDGSCLVWSLLAFVHNTPQTGGRPSVEEMMAMRKDLFLNSACFSTVRRRGHYHIPCKSLSKLRIMPYILVLQKCMKQIFSLQTYGSHMPKMI